MTEPSSNTYMLLICDLGYIPPLDAKPERNESLLEKNGWTPVEALFEVADLDRLFCFEKDHVRLVLDDTGLAVFILPEPVGRRKQRLADETIGLLSDWRKGSGTKRLPSLLMNVSRMSVADCGWVDVRGRVNGGIVDLLFRQTRHLATGFTQHKVGFGDWRDFLLQRARMSCYRTSPLVDWSDVRWDEIAAQLEAYDAYMDACYLNSDRMARMSGMLLATLFSMTGIVSLTLTWHWNITVVVVAFFVVGLLFFLSIPRKTL